MQIWRQGDKTMTKACLEKVYHSWIYFQLKKFVHIIWINGYIENIVITYKRTTVKVIVNNSSHN